MASLREAILTMGAALVSLAAALALDPEPGSAILAVVLSLSLSRSHLDRDLRGRVEAAVLLPVVSLGAIGVGLLLRNWPWVGAAAFVAVLSLSVGLRRYGPLGRKIGTLIALPCVVLLVAPPVHSKALSPAMALAVPVIVALIALLSVSVFHAIGQRLGWLPKPQPAAELAAPPAAGMRLVPSDRMALQMAVALGVAFALGYLVFAPHWAWLVLTAFIVSSGNQGRLDVAYKSVLRVLGAAAGTVGALLFAHGIGVGGAGTGVLVLLAVFLGLWLRPISYAWWALFITLALALLQGFEGTAPQSILLPRLTEIVIGALIGVGSAWFVLPVHSTDVLRRRIADALAALSEAFDPANTTRTAEPFIAELKSVDKVAAAFRAARLLARGKPHHADWVDALMACREPALALIEQGAMPGSVRKAVGAARKAMREPAQIQPALAELRAALEAAETTMPATISTKAAP